MLFGDVLISKSRGGAAIIRDQNLFFLIVLCLVHAGQSKLEMISSQSVPVMWVEKEWEG